MFAQLHSTFNTPAGRKFLYVLYDNLPYVAKVLEDINARARRNAPIHQRGADGPVRPQEGRAGRTEPEYAASQGRPDNAARPAKPDGQQTRAARALVTGRLSFSQGKVPTESELAAAEKAEGVPSKLVESWKTLPFGVIARNAMSGWRGNPWLLGALSLDQLKDRFPDFKNVAKTVNSWLNMGNRANQMMRPVADLHKQWASFTRNNKAHGQTLNKLFIEATLGGVWVDGTTEPRQDPCNKHLDFADPQVVKAATAARSLYMSLPEEGRRLHREIDHRRPGMAVCEARQQALLKRVVDMYRADLDGVLSPDAISDGGHGVTGYLCHTAGFQTQQN